MLAVANSDRIFAAVVYWYIWTVLLPRRGGYSLEEKSDVHEDGTVTKKLVRCYAFH